MNEKFEPTIGNYVETIKGEIGYIIEFYDSCCFIKFKDIVKVYECTSLDEKYFKQIGTYKFNQNKNIEKYTETVDARSNIIILARYSMEHPTADDIINKINEIVDAVNKLNKE